MQVLRARLIEKIKRAQAVESFRLLPEKKFGFLPGQFLQLIFDTKADNKELNKYLSLSCSPTKEYLEVTKKLSESKFSQKLKQLRINDEVCFKGPFGNCAFKEEYTKIGFLIGGIGITPVISIIEYIIDKRLPTDAVLLYSNKTDIDITFKNELDHWQGEASNIKVFYTVTDCRPKDISCIMGRIDKDLLLDKLKDYGKRQIFIFGPPNMVETMNNLCLGVGCQKENVLIENFIGY